MKTQYVVLAFALIAACSPDTATRNRPAEEQNMKKGIDPEACKKEAKYQCQYECIEKEAPPNRNKCEVECMKRPMESWNGSIPACTA